MDEYEYLLASIGRLVARVDEKSGKCKVTHVRGTHQIAQTRQYPSFGISYWRRPSTVISREVFRGRSVLFDRNCGWRSTRRGEIGR